MIMYIMKPIIWMVLMEVMVSIVQECNLNQDYNECPAHSSCGDRGYCVCDNGWILNCQTQAQLIPLNQSYQSLEL